MSFDALFYLTALFLVLFFLAAETLRQRRARSGRLVAFLQSPNPAAGMIESRALVKLDSGEEVEVTVPTCVMCMGRLCEGDRVSVNACADGYRAGLPSWSGRRWGKAVCNRKAGEA